MKVAVKRLKGVCNLIYIELIMSRAVIYCSVLEAASGGSGSFFVFFGGGWQEVRVMILLFLRFFIVGLVCTHIYMK